MSTAMTMTIGRLAATVAIVLATGPLAVAAEGLPVAAPSRTEPVRFEQEILPFFAANCTACHNAKVREGGLMLDGVKAILAGGDSGAAVVAGKPAESLLFLRAAHRQEDFMPPADNKVGAKPLSPEQLGLLERWIAEGAAAGPATVRVPVAWKPLPRGFGGVVAVAMTDDGRKTAAARASFVELFDSMSGLRLASLVDPASAAGGTAADRAHLDAVSAMAFAPDGERLATGSFRTIKLWRRRAAARSAETPDSAAATSMAVAPNGAAFAVGMTDGRVHLCEATTGKIVRTIAAHAAPVAGLAFSADTATIHSVARDGTIVSTRAADGVGIGRLVRPAGIRAMLPLDGGTRLAVSEADGVLRIWPLPLPAPPAEGAAAVDVKPLKELAGIPQPTTVLCDVPTMSGHLLTAGGDGIARLWNVDSGGAVRQFVHGGGIVAMAVRPDGSRLATVGTIPGVKLWDLSSGAAVAETKGDHRLADSLRAAEIATAVRKQDVDFAKAEVSATEKAGQTAADESKKAAEQVAAAEKTLAEKTAAATASTAAKAAADETSTRAAADAQAATTVQEAAAKVKAAAVATADAATAGVAAAKAAPQPAAEAIQKLEAASAASAAAKVDAENAAAAADAQVAPAKARAADAEKKVAEAGTARDAAEEARKQAETATTSAKRLVEFAAEQTKRAAADLPVNKAALAAAEKGAVDAEQFRAKLAGDHAASARPFGAVAFSRDGAWLGCIDLAGRLAVLGGGDGQPRWSADAVRPAMAADQTASIGFTSDGRIAVAGGPSSAAVWEASDSWSLERTIGGERTPPADDDDPSGPPVDVVTALAFSPDGQWLASGGGRTSRSGEIKLWKVADGSLARSLPSPHSDTVMDLQFSRRGDLLASGAADRFLKVHAVADGGSVKSFEGHTGHVLGVAWQANGRRLASAGADGAVKIWDFVTGEQQRSIAVGTKEVSAIRFVDALEEALAASGVPAIRLVNAATAAVVREYPNPGDFVQSLAVAGPFVAAGGQDGRLRIWNLATAAATHTIEPAAK